MQNYYIINYLFCVTLLLQNNVNLLQTIYYTYTRTVVDQLILHNNRADMIKKLFFTANIIPIPEVSTEQKGPTSPTKGKQKAKSRRSNLIEASKRMQSATPEEIKVPPKPPKPTEEMIKVGPEDFDIITLIGKGSFGEVYLVRYKETGQVYAMKVILKKKMLASNLMKYAKAERNVLCQMRHPFIVGIDFAFQTSDRLFLILEYCPGGDIGKILEKETRITEERAKIYAAEVLLALEDLHKHDIIFRDLKPDNVVLDADGHAMLTDFGLSKEGVIDNISTKSFCGSVAYLAPEMLKKSGHGKSVDWYLFGVLIFEMLVGVPPYFSSNKDKLFKNIVSAPLKLPMYLSEDVCNLIVACLNRNPHKRLGAGKEDANEIKRHPWFNIICSPEPSLFKNFDWDLVLKRELAPPKPKLKPIPATSLNPDIFSGASRSANHISGWEFAIPAKNSRKEGDFAIQHTI